MLLWLWHRPAIEETASLGTSTCLGHSPKKTKMKRKERERKKETNKQTNLTLKKRKQRDGNRAIQYKRKAVTLVYY